MILAVGVDVVEKREVACGVVDSPSDRVVQCLPAAAIGQVRVAAVLGEGIERGQQPYQTAIRSRFRPHSSQTLGVAPLRRSDYKTSLTQVPDT